MDLISKFLIRLGPYSASVLVTFAVGVLSVPFIIHLAGASTWAALAVVQSIASFATVLVSFGWGATGPNLIARLQPGDRPGALVRSFWARILLFAVVVPIGAALAIAITALPPAAAVIGLFGYSIQALGAVWYFVGESKPFRVLLLDATPRAVGVVLGVVALWMWGIVAFTACIAAAGLFSLVSSYVLVLRGTKTRLRPTFSMVGRELVAQRHGVITTIAASLYYNSSLIVVSVLAPQSIEVFALVFKLYNYAGAALVPVLQFAQGWIPSGDHDQLRSRVQRAGKFSILAASALALGAALLLPVAGSLLSLNTVQIPYSLSIPFGICIGAMLVNQVVGQAGLVSIGKARSLAVSTAFGAVAGTTLQVIGAVMAAATGVAVALATTDVVVAAVQALIVRSWLRSSAGSGA